MVAEAHRILTRGGIFVSPGHGRAAGQARQPWLLQEVNPISFVIERAGGRASTGTGRVLDVESSALPVRPSLIFGSAEEVERLEAYHASHEAGSYDAPLFSQRGLFRSSV
jgi:fructose-1,6-bisphosphatase I/sedoheptulose-1,7-bisphosphatase